MNNFTLDEFADMHLCLGQAEGNGEEAKRIYLQKYPNRRQPDRRTFYRVDRSLRESGRMKVQNNNAGRPRRTRTFDREERILNLVENNPRISSRRVSAIVGQISHQSVLRVLHEQQLRPYHIQPIQALHEGDHNRRLNFSRWFIQKCVENDLFLNTILSTDEAMFTNNGMFNIHNEHEWSEENPHSFMQVQHQHRFSINVWAGVVENYLLGPIELPNRINAQVYQNFLEEDLPQLLENVPLNIRLQMWYLQDGHPAHNARVVQQYLNGMFPNRWIGTHGPIGWPARSPDLNPIDFCIWGYAKNLVYANETQTREELWQKICDAFDTIRNTPLIFQKIRWNWRKRAEACVQSHGQHFQHLL